MSSCNKKRIICTKKTIHNSNNKQTKRLRNPSNPLTNDNYYSLILRFIPSTNIVSSLSLLSKWHYQSLLTINIHKLLQFEFGCLLKSSLFAVCNKTYMQQIYDQRRDAWVTKRLLLKLRLVKSDHEHDEKSESEIQSEKSQSQSASVSTSANINISLPLTTYDAVYLLYSKIRQLQIVENVEWLDLLRMTKYAFYYPCTFYFAGGGTMTCTSTRTHNTRSDSSGESSSDSSSSGIIYKDDHGAEKVNIFDMNLNADLIINDKAYKTSKSQYCGNETLSDDEKTIATKNTKQDNVGTVEFTKIKPLKTSEQLLDEYDKRKEWYERVKQLPQLCWKDIVVDVQQYHYFDRLVRDDGCDDNDYSHYYSTFAQLLQVYHTSEIETNKQNNQSSTSCGVQTNKLSDCKIAYKVVENTRQFDIVSGVKQFVLCIMSKTSAIPNDRPNNKIETSLINQAVVYYCQQQLKLGVFIEISMHSGKMIQEFKQNLEKDSNYRAFSFELVYIPTHLRKNLCPFVIPKQTISTQRTGFTMSIFNLFICDMYEYYKIHKWNIDNIRFYRGCTWENETCLYGNYYNANKFGRSERVKRLYSINAAKARGVYASTKDKILCTEFKCKTRKVFKDGEKNGKQSGQLEAIVDDTTPEILLVDNIYPYYFVPGIFQFLVFYRGNQLTTSEANKLMIKILKDHFGLCVDESTLDMNVNSNEKQDLESILNNIRNKPIKDYLWWENPPQFKSISDLNHVQLIIRNKKLYDLPIKSGFCVCTREITPYSWEKLNEMIDNSNHLCYNRIAREERCLRDYYQHMRKRLNIYCDILDVILVYGMKLSLNCLESDLTNSSSSNNSNNSNNPNKWRVDRKYININNVSNLNKTCTFRGDDIDSTDITAMECDNGISIMYCLSSNEFPYYVDIENDILWIVLFSKDIKHHSEVRQGSLTQLIGSSRIESIVQKSLANKKKTNDDDESGWKWDDKSCLWFENKSKFKMMDGSCNAYQSNDPQVGYFSIHCIHVMHR